MFKYSEVYGNQYVHVDVKKLNDIYEKFFSSECIHAIQTKEKIVYIDYIEDDEKKIEADFDAYASFGAETFFGSLGFSIGMLHSGNDDNGSLKIVLRNGVMWCIEDMDLEIYEEYKEEIKEHERKSCMDISEIALRFDDIKRVIECYDLAFKGNSVEEMSDLRYTIHCRIKDDYENLKYWHLIFFNSLLIKDELDVIRQLY